MSPVAEYEEVGHIFRPELHGSGSNLSPWRRRLISLTYNAISNKATAPTTRSRDIVSDDATVPSLDALGDDCLLVDAAEA